MTRVGAFWGKPGLRGEGKDIRGSPPETPGREPRFPSGGLGVPPDSLSPLLLNQFIREGGTGDEVTLKNTDLDLRSPPGIK